MTTPDHLKQRLAATPTGDLQSMVTDASETLAAIQAELDRREREQQHVAIERLDEYLADARPKWGEVKAFFDLVLKELRK